MENFHQPFFPSTTTTMTPIYEPMSSSPSILASSSMSNYYPRVQYLPPTNGSGQLYFQSLYPHFQKQASQPPFQYRRHPLLLPRPQPNPVSGDQGGIESKAARDQRRMARQRRLFSSRSAAESVSSSSPTQMDLCGADSDCQNTDLCTRTPDMKVAAWFIFFFYTLYVCLLTVISLSWIGTEKVVQEGVEEEWCWLLGQDCHSKGEVISLFFALLNEPWNIYFIDFDFHLSIISMLNN